jgi:hypothetical protein
MTSNQKFLVFPSTIRAGRYEVVDRVIRCISPLTPEDHEWNAICNPEHRFTGLSTKTVLAVSATELTFRAELSGGPSTFVYRRVK